MEKVLMSLQVCQLCFGEPLSSLVLVESPLVPFVRWFRTCENGGGEY